jgi:hypothetical protein
MADDKIRAYDRHGEKITIDKSEIGKLYALGGRVATNAEKDAHDKEEYTKASEKAVQERYDALPTSRKVLGGVTTAAHLLTGNPLLAGTNIDAPPTLAAYGQGVREGLTFGASEVAGRKAAEAIGGKAAGDKFAEQVDEQAAASPIAHGAGSVAGMVGQAALGSASGVLAKGATAIAPNAAKAVGTTAAKVAARGALGRAAVTAAEMGLQGGIEGGVYGGASYTTDQLLHDKDLAADKLFAATGTGALYGLGGGVLLGGAGSLAASGARAAGRRASGALSRAFAPAEEALAGAEAKAATEAPAVRTVLSDLGSEAGTKGLAYDRAWGALGSGFGLQSTEFAKRAARYLPNGTRDVGEVLMRKNILSPQAGIIDAARTGTPSAMLPKLEAEVESVGRRLGELTDASGGRVQSEAIMHAIKDVAAPYDAAAATRPIGKALRSYGDVLLDSLGIARGAESVAVQDVLRERKALDLMVFENAALDPNITTQVKRELRGRLEGLVVDALDVSSGRLKGELAVEYKALKKDYLALNIAKEAAEDSSARAAKAGFFGLKDLAAGGGSIAKTAASKLLRERGDAIAATMLYRAAERGTLTKWLQKVDDQIGKASKGLLQEPAKGAAKASERMPAPKLLAKTALTRVGEFQADPEAFVEKATRQAESVGVHDPEIADGIVSRQVRAMAFLSSKVPVTPDPDPLDPHPAPKMTESEQAEFGRYAWYVEKPDRFFAEVARGKITFEGAEVAQALMPRAFADLQERTMEAIATQMAKGNKLPYRQREMIGVLLDIAATPAQRPEHAAFLQQNVSGMLPSEEPPPPAPAKKRAASIPTQRSSYDRLEAGGPGQR